MSQTAFRVLINIPVILIAFMLGFYLPELSPKDVLWGFKISPEDRHASTFNIIINEYKKLYLIICGSFSLLFIIMFSISGHYYLLLLGLLTLMLLIEIVQHLAYKRTKHLDIFKNLYKSYTNYTIIDERSQRNLSLSLNWFLVPGLIIIISIITGAAVYQIVPNFLPAGLYAASSEIHYIKKTLYLIAIPSLLQSAFLGVAWIIFIKVSSLKLPSNNTNTEVVEQKAIIFRYVCSVSIIAICTLINIFFFFIELRLLDFIGTKMLSLSTVLIVLFIAAVIFTAIKSIRKNQNSMTLLSILDSLKKRDIPSLIDRADDSFWILGSFYFNPHDPSSYIKKRTGRGISFNFARPLTWLIFSLPITLLLLTFIYLLINKI